MLLGLFLGSAVVGAAMTLFLVWHIMEYCDTPAFNSAHEKGHLASADTYLSLLGAPMSTAFVKYAALYEYE